MQSSLIRLFDIIFSILGLILFSPIFIILSVLIIKNMGAPILFSQRRVGLSGRRFTVYKFRSMSDENIIDDEHLEKVNEYTIKYKNDPRVTSLGSFLRKTSLDELPQFWNVLLGEMSFVGPRPWVPEEYEKLPKEWHERLNAKPGITGFAQINGRSDLDMDKIVENDLLWVKRQNIKYYFEVLIKTFVYTLKMRNVY